MSTIATPNSMNPTAVTLSGAIMVSSVIVIFFLFVFFLILYFRSNIRYITTEITPQNSPSPNFACGLHPLVLKSLPVKVFKAGDFREGIECAICISEISDGEKFRFLPGCRHSFHLECIDMWFGSNSTCPVCRRSVELAKDLILSNEEKRCGVKKGSWGVDCEGEGSSRIAQEISGFSLQWSKRSLILDVEQGIPVEVARIGVEGEESSSS